MQTFLPLPNLKASATCLDNKRLGKQRVECKQILLCLGIPIGDHRPNESRWRNHPAVQMWAGNEIALIVYSAVVCRVWRQRGFRDTLYDQFIAAYRLERGDAEFVPYPRWFGKKKFHASHRSNLLRKDSVHYGKFGWSEPDDLPYYWPAPDNIIVPV